MPKKKMPICCVCDREMDGDDPRPLALKDAGVIVEDKYFCSDCQKNLREALRWKPNEK